MKLSFRLYANGRSEYKSSVFDLIDGTRETKQTKSLGYLLSQYRGLLFDFLSLDPVNNEVVRALGTSLQRKRISAIEVSAERFTEDRQRADIVIRIDQGRKPLLAVIIEAKSIRATIQKAALHYQITGYLNDAGFPGIELYPKIGVVLTKYKQSIPGVASLSWDEVINMLIRFCRKKGNEKGLARQYLDFLLQIDRSMNYYEKEVLSIPAGKTLSRVVKHKIYECPDTAKYSHKKPLFICFRQKHGGVMDCLYKIEDIIVLTPADKADLEILNNSTFPDSWKRRIFAYINDTGYPKDLNHDKRFYVLSETENIPLSHQPRPPRNNTGHTYYSLVDILTKDVVLPESRAMV